MFTILFLLASTTLLLLSTVRNIARSSVSKGSSTTHLSIDIPTVSLCIPARNENHALADCLEAAVASNYPKLEILVLDDCSQDHTSNIIRGFAQDGVRFIQGDTPSDGWLGKNNAYELLSREARGDYIVFLSVDTLLEPTTLSVLVEYMQSKKLSMTSVLPIRRTHRSMSDYFGPLRYFWQLATPYRFNTPVTSSLWAIRSDALEKIGGFGIVKHSILPENSLAKLLDGKYHFLVSNNVLAVYYEKRWSSQVDTAIRLWYPLLHRRPIRVLFAALLHIFLFVLPPLLFMKAIYLEWYSEALFVLLVIVLQLYLFLRYQLLIHKSMFVAIISAILTPVTTLQEVVLIMASWYQYARGRVDWKGRNVCYPKQLGHKN